MKNKIVGGVLVKETGNGTVREQSRGWIEG
jgi:hypothetical protein